MDRRRIEGRSSSQEEERLISAHRKDTGVEQLRAKNDAGGHK